MKQKQNTHTDGRIYTKYDYCEAFRKQTNNRHLTKNQTWRAAQASEIHTHIPKTNTHKENKTKQTRTSVSLQQNPVAGKEKR